MCAPQTNEIVVGLRLLLERLLKTRQGGQQTTCYRLDRSDLHDRRKTVVG